MIHLITGNPGSKKTAYCVSMLYNIEKDNKVNIVKNVKAYKHNMELLTQKNLLNHLTYFENPIGTGETLKYEIEILPDDYFDMLGQNEFGSLRPDDYFKRAVRFNDIIDRIVENHGKMGFYYFLPVRTIYTNIEALSIDYVRSLVADWRQCPDGSLIVIDEIQLVYPYSETKDKSHPIITELSVHRHRGFDFYFITQSAGNLHVLLKDLVHVHYHVTVPFGFRTKIYQYGEFKANPNAKTVKLSAESTISFTPKAHIFKLYKSTTINTSQTRLPWKYLLSLVSFMAFGLMLVYYSFFSDSGVVDAYNKHTKDDTQQSNTFSNIKQVVQDTATITQTDTQNQDTQQDINQRVYISTHQKYLPQYTIEVANDPAVFPASVVSMGGKCVAFNTYGDKLALDQTQCNTMLKDGTLPKLRKEQSSQTEESIQTEKSIQTQTVS